MTKSQMALEALKSPKEMTLEELREYLNNPMVCWNERAQQTGLKLLEIIDNHSVVGMEWPENAMLDVAVENISERVDGNGDFGELNESDLRTLLRFTALNLQKQRKNNG